MKDNWDNKWSEYIKSTLEEYDAPVPNNYWNTIQQSIATSKSSLYSIIKLAALGLVGTGVIMVLYFAFIKEKSLNDSTQAKVTFSLLPPKPMNIKVLSSNQSLSPVTKFKMKEDKFTLYNAQTPKKVTEANSQVDVESTIDFEPESIGIEKVRLSSIQSEKIRDLRRINPKKNKLKVRNKSKELYWNLGVDAGSLKLNEYNFYVGPYAEIGINRLGCYTGFIYNPNEVNEITVGEGANNTTVSEITRKSLQHRITLFTGLKYTVMDKDKNKLFVNSGVCFKSLIINDKGGSGLPFMLSSGIEYRIPLINKYHASIYYNYMFTVSDKTKNGHQAGIRFLLK